MAKATITKEVVTSAIIHLDMSEDEAHALADILDRVGGCPTTSRRRHSESLRTALKEVGMRGYNKGTDLGDISSSPSGGIYFTEEKS